MLDVSHLVSWCDAEAQVPDELLERACLRGARLVVGCRGDVTAEALGSDPPSAPVGTDALERFEVRERHVRERSHVIRARCATVVPDPKVRGTHRGDHGFVHRREEHRLPVTSEEGVDVSGEPGHPRAVAETRVVVGQSEVTQIDHG